jgi:hypothetical protein
MTRRWIQLASVLLLVVAMQLGPVSPIHLDGSARAQTAGRPEQLTLNVRGSAPRDPTKESHRFQYTADLYSLASGEKVGTASHNVMFTSASTADHRVTFHLPDGDLVSHAVEVFAPDSTKPGFFLVGVHPEGKTILPEHGTGAYAGRTGRLRMAAWHDATKFPNEVSFDDFYVIELDPAT